MRRRDYELIAKALRDSQPLPNGDRARDWHRGWSEARDAIADALVQDNPAFDRARFIQDTGGE